MRSERHRIATWNYVLHNPAHHRYVQRWSEWPWSSAQEFLAQVGHMEAKRRWRQYRFWSMGRTGTLRSFESKCSLTIARDLRTCSESRL
jgi:putative transposase